MDVNERCLPQLRADFHSFKLQCPAVNSSQQPITKLHSIHKVARDFCQSLALRINQNCAGQAMDYPSFVSGWTVARIGAKFDPEMIFLDSIIVVNKGLRHQAHQLLELDLILVLRLL
jgi:hypothetical protein